MKKIRYPDPNKEKEQAMGERCRRWVWLSAVVLILCGFIQAKPVLGREKEPLENSRPIVITSDTLDVDNKNKMATFAGSVMAKQDQEGKEPIFIYCDSMTVYYAEDPVKKAPASPKNRTEKKELTEQNRVEKIVATGRVKIVQGKDLATGETATFYNSDQRIVLSGEPKVWQGKNLIKGEEITVWIKENRSRVTSKGSTRVQAVIHQEEKK
jgi:lipopolysaccharide export system protein LptA